MYKIDKTDRLIVNLLMEDGRMPCAELARRLGNITERSVRYRLERLRESGLIKIAIITNHAALGFLVTADVFIEVEPGLIPEVANKLVKFPNVTYVAFSTGDRDISAQVIARNNADAYAFVTEVIAKVPGVRKTNTSIVPVILKDTYDWHIPALSDASDNESGE
jgi:Lrp/AsnC family transcriptional regulator, regulator for asnA, asnC and gidA